MTKAMYLPKVQTQVQEALTHARQRHKAHYDKSAKCLAQLQTGNTVRMQTTRGYDQLAIVTGTAARPNSYQVQVGDAAYTRNRRHLLLTPESYTPPTTTTYPPSSATADQPPGMQPAIVQPEVAQAQEGMIITRSGRVSRPNTLYKDYTS